MDWLTQLIGKMLTRTKRGMVQGMQEGMQEVLNELVKGTLDPAKLAEMMKKMGFDPAQLSTPGFDPYRIIGLDKSASDEEVKKRYHELLQKLHPDTAGVEGTAFLFQMALAAFELIKKERGWQ